MVAGCFVLHRIVSENKTAEFVSHILSNVAVRGDWCNVIVLNVHEPSEKKSDESKDIFLTN